MISQNQSMLNDGYQQLEVARKYSETNPELYLQYLQSEEDSTDESVISEMNKIGLEALKRIPTDYKVRGKIALITADYDRKMMKNVERSIDFSREKFEAGLGSLDKDIQTDREEDFFRNVFRKWKSTVRLSDDWKEKLILQIRKWISRRAEGIVGGQKWNYYGECAEYIAAFGEVMESLGKRDVKQDLIMHYWMKYPRHRAFHEELRRFNH